MRSGRARASASRPFPKAWEGACRADYVPRSVGDVCVNRDYSRRVTNRTIKIDSRLIALGYLDSFVGSGMIDIQAMS
jgi:hypothetical protein